MRCPECYSTFLEEKQTKDKHVKLDICPRCSGVWFDKDELPSVLESAEKQLSIPSQAETSKRSCPRCRRPMRIFNYPDTFVKVDVCEHCHGIWLDKGEFKELSMVRRFKAAQQTQIAAALRKAGAPDEPDGVKGALINMINRAIDSMIHFE